MESVLTLKTLSEIFAKYNPNLEVISYKVKRIQEAHYMSVMYSVLVEVKDGSGIDDNTFTKSIMFKTMPSNPIRRSYFREGKYFNRESVMYLNVLPKLNTISGLNTFPQVLHADLTCDTEYIAMEDLSEKGFKVADRLKGLDLEHSLLFIKELARFHASSFIPYNGDGRTMQEDFPELTEHFWVLVAGDVPEMPKLFMSNTLKDIEKLLNEEKLEHFIPKVRKAMEQSAFTILPQLNKVPSKFPSAILHGDCWTNNIMFRYNEKGHPIELKFVDFQLSKVGSRCIDLAYGMYTSINPSVLKERMEEFLHLYYDTFNDVCVQIGASLPLTFKGRELTWEYFMEEWNIHSYSEVVSGLLFIPIMNADPSNPVDLEVMEESDLKQKEGEQTNFSTMWQFKPMREKLIDFITCHVPEDFKL